MKSLRDHFFDVFFFTSLGVFFLGSYKLANHEVRLLDIEQSFQKVTDSLSNVANRIESLTNSGAIYHIGPTNGDSLFYRDNSDAEWDVPTNRFQAFPAITTNDVQLLCLDLETLREDYIKDQSNRWVWDQQWNVAFNDLGRPIGVANTNEFIPVAWPDHAWSMDAVLEGMKEKGMSNIVIYLISERGDNESLLKITIEPPSATILQISPKMNAPATNAPIKFLNFQPQLEPASSDFKIRTKKAATAARIFQLAAGNFNHVTIMNAESLAAQLYTQNAAARNHKNDIGEKIPLWSELKPNAGNGFDTDKITVAAWVKTAIWVLDNKDEIYAPED